MNFNETRARAYRDRSAAPSILAAAVFEINDFGLPSKPLRIAETERGAMRSCSRKEISRRGSRISHGSRAIASCVSSKRDCGPRGGPDPRLAEEARQDPKNLT